MKEEMIEIEELMRKKNILHQDIIMINTAEDHDHREDIRERLVETTQQKIQSLSKFGSVQIIIDYFLQIISFVQQDSSNFQISKFQINFFKFFNFQ